MLEKLSAELAEREKVTVDCTPLILKCAVVVLPFNVIDRAESKLHTHRHSCLFYRRFLLIGKKKVT
jgi:hypothetical protein